MIFIVCLKGKGHWRKKREEVRKGDERRKLECQEEEQEVRAATTLPPKTRASPPTAPAT